MLQEGFAQGGHVASTHGGGLEEALGFNFSDKALLRQALTHSSCVHENPQLGPDNEPLEFLGDAVLGLAVGHLLLETYPAYRPGQLSKLRAAAVNERTLARLAGELGLGAALRLGRGEEATGGRAKPSILAGACEALLGAIYLDGGFPAALEIVRRQFSPLPRPAADYKTALQEHCQARHRVSPHYRLEEASGPPHRRTFQISAWLGERLLATGQGRSKKEAETAAARAALVLLAAEEEEP
jgi:ribonuclease-3